jgi:hypothetical protein
LATGSSEGIITDGFSGVSVFRDVVFVLVTGECTASMTESGKSTESA